MIIFMLAAPEQLYDEQQEAQHALTIFISRTQALLGNLVMKNGDKMDEERYAEIAGLVYRLTQQLAGEVDRRQTIGSLSLLLGTAEKGQVTPSSIVAEHLSAGGQPQVINTSREVEHIIRPSIIDGLYLVKRRQGNGGPTRKLDSYYLAGIQKLPKGYQLPLSK